MTKASEGIFDDSVVYVTRQGSQVGVDGGRIIVYMKGEGELASFPMGQVDTINIFGNVHFTTPFVARANEHGIVLNYFTQNGRYRGSFVPEKNTIAEVRRRQYALSERESLRNSEAYGCGERSGTPAALLEPQGRSPIIGRLD